MAPPDDTSVPARLEHGLEALIFASRWLMAPFYLGLVVALGLLLVVFATELVHGLYPALTDQVAATMLILSLIDLSLVGNLLLIVIFSGYESFVSKIPTGDSEDRPQWMGAIDYSGMKHKLIGSVVAISAVALLRGFVRLTQEARAAEAAGAHTDVDFSRMQWALVVHGVLVMTAVLFALADWIAGKAKH